MSICFSFYLHVYSFVLPSQACGVVLAPGAAAAAYTADTVTPAVAPDFASRYKGEIASQARVREYRQLGLRHRASLTAEARGLQGGAAGGPAGTAQRAAGGGAGLPLRGRVVGTGGIGGGGVRVGGARNGLGEADGARQLDFGCELLKDG